MFHLMAKRSISLLPSVFLHQTWVTPARYNSHLSHCLTVFSYVVNLITHMVLQCGGWRGCVALAEITGRVYVIELTLLWTYLHFFLVIHHPPTIKGNKKKTHLSSFGEVSPQNVKRSGVFVSIYS